MVNTYQSDSSSKAKKIEFGDVIAVGFPLLALFVFVVLLDSYCAWTLNWEVVGFIILFATLITAGFLSLFRRPGPAIPWLVFIVCLIVLRFVNVSPVKPFTKFFDSVRVGMTELEMQAQLEAHFPIDGRFSQPIPRRLKLGKICINLDLNDSRYNAEVVLISTENGRVTNKEYHAD